MNQSEQGRVFVNQSLASHKTLAVWVLGSLPTTTMPDTCLKFHQRLSNECSFGMCIAFGSGVFAEPCQSFLSQHQGTLEIAEGYTFVCSFYVSSFCIFHVKSNFPLMMISSNAQNEITIVCYSLNLTWILLIKKGFLSNLLNYNKYQYVINVFILKKGSFATLCHIYNSCLH